MFKMSGDATSGWCVDVIPLMSYDAGFCLSPFQNRLLFRWFPISLAEQVFSPPPLLLYCIFLKKGPCARDCRIFNFSWHLQILNSFPTDTLFEACQHSEHQIKDWRYFVSRDRRRNWKITFRHSAQYQYFVLSTIHQTSPISCLRWSFTQKCQNLPIQKRRSELGHLTPARRYQLLGLEDRRRLEQMRGTK